MQGCPSHQVRETMIGMIACLDPVKAQGMVFVAMAMCSSHGCVRCHAHLKVCDAVLWSNIPHATLNAAVKPQTAALKLALLVIVVLPVAPGVTIVPTAKTRMPKFPVLRPP
jgi:hypothetical protein